MPKRERVLVEIAGKEVGFGAVLRAMNHELREEVLERLARLAAELGLQGPLPQQVVDVYAECHLERFGVPFRVEGER